MIIQFIIAWLSTYWFGVIFNVRGKRLLYSAFGGGFAWLFYYKAHILGYSTGISFFVATFFLTIYSEIVSRYIKTVVTSILIPGLIPLVPGSGIYYTMLYTVDKKPIDAFFKGLDTLSAAGSIALGIIVVSSIVKIFKDLKKKKL